MFGLKALGSGWLDERCAIGKALSKLDLAGIDCNAPVGGEGESGIYLGGIYQAGGTTCTVRE
jgi:hypothetical protein